MSYIADLLYQGFMFGLTFGTYNAYQNHKKINSVYKKQHENMLLLLEDNKQNFSKLNEPCGKVLYLNKLKHSVNQLYKQMENNEKTE